MRELNHSNKTAHEMMWVRKLSKHTLNVFQMDALVLKHDIDMSSPASEDMFPQLPKYCHKVINC